MHQDEYNDIDRPKDIDSMIISSINGYNIKESIIMATNMKNHRPEVEQIEYINEGFIILDDVNCITDWINEPKQVLDYHSYNRPFLTKEIIYINNNKLISNEYHITYNYLIGLLYDEF